MLSSKDIALAVAHCGVEKKGSDVLIMEIGKVSHITDYFVIMHATNRTLTAALADAVAELARDTLQIEHPHIEGQDGDWLLLDLGSVVVHIFLEETRFFYDLEHLWVDAPLLPVN